MDIPLEARTTFRYDGRLVVRGESFSARSAPDAQLLVLLQKAKHADPVPAEPDSEPTPTKRHYRRKDLAVEVE